MRNRGVIIGLVGVLLALFAGITGAQDDDMPLKLAQGVGLSTEDGLLILSVPGDWIAETSAESVLLSSADGVISGVVTFALRDDLGDEEITPDDYLVQTFGLADDEDDRYTDFSDVTTPIFNGRDGAIASGVQTTGAITRDVTLITLNAGEALVTFIFTAEEGAGADAIPVYIAIAGSMDFAPPFEASAMQQ